MPISFHHIPSRSDHPWNELCDSLVRSPNAFVYPVDSDLREVFSSQRAWQWQWWWDAPLPVKAAYPPFKDGAFIADWKAPAAHPDMISPHRPPDPGTVQQIKLTFQVTSYNALTTKDERTKGGQIQTTNRGLHIRQQFSAMGHALIGIQEARLPEGREKQNGFLIFSSPARDGGKT